MRLSRDKVNVLARAVADALKQMDEVDFIEDPNTIRQETRKILEDLLNQEARIDQSARLKIESQKRTILEGSQESGHPISQVLQRGSEEAGSVIPRFATRCENPVLRISAASQRIQSLPHHRSAKPS